MKRDVESLGLFGGAPEFEEPLHVGRPNIGDRTRLMQRIESMLDRHWLTNDGPYVQEFEQRVAELLGVKHCVAMCNGTVALEIAIRALGLSGEVIVPSFTFVATPHALQWQEITPVFCDVDSETCTLDPTSVEQMITPRTTGIIGVHLWGRPCEVDALQRIADKHDLALLFDAAHAFACSHRGRMIGSFGRAEVFSFHATKFFNTFEGGAVTTDDDALATKMRLMKNFGFSGYDNVIYIGTNGKMSEVCGAMGLTGLEDLDRFVTAGHANYRAYRSGLKDIPGIELLEYPDDEHCNYQYIILQVDETHTGLDRDALVKVLHSENILARRYFYPGCHRMEPYRSYYPHAGLLVPRTERLARRVLALPTGTTLGASEIERICAVIRVAADHGADVVRRLNENPLPVEQKG